METIDECALLGACLLSSQKFEFVLYGLASHLPNSKKEKRFQLLTPKKFLRGNVDDLKATLGQLEVAFGDKLGLSTEELKKFIKNRNLIVHNYWRLTKAKIEDAHQLENPQAFLEEFLKSCDKWTMLARGLLWLMIQVSAETGEKEEKLHFDEQQIQEMEAYALHRAMRSGAVT